MKNFSVSPSRVSPLRVSPLRVSPSRRAALLTLSVLGFGAGAMCLPMLTPAAHAAPKKNKSALEIWPGQRVLLVLPLTIGPNWNGGPELAEAVKPLVRSQLQSAFSGTGKFSVTLPYRFDPILRRAVSDNLISDDIVAPFVSSPSLQTAEPIFSKLKFDQVPMVTQVQLEELRVGGTTQKPTLQLQVSAKLYEIGGGGPVNSVVITSNPAGGETPQERLQNASADAFRQVAEFFVKPPASFELPLSLTEASKDGMEKEKKDGMGMGMDKNKKAMDNMGMDGNAKAPAATSPNAMAPQAGMPMIPVLPAGEPPLGIAPANEKALDR